METGQYDFTIYQGATFYREITYKTSAGAVVDLSSYSARMKIRNNGPEGEEILSLATTPGTGLTVAASSPNITITISSTETAAMDFDQASYDLEIVSPGGVVDRLLMGVVDLSREATR